MSNLARLSERLPTTKARDQVLLSALVGAVAIAVAVAFLPWQAAVLIGWDITAVAWLAWTAVTVMPMGADDTRAAILREDDSRAARDSMLVGASLASLVWVVLLLVKAASEKGAAHSLMTALGAATVVVSWAAVHLLFSLRYAQLYYSGDAGMDFHDDHLPTFGDFVYVAFTIGMTYQVSDTELTSRPARMTALRHSLLAYLFGTASIAVTINVIAALLTK